MPPGALGGWAEQVAGRGYRIEKKGDDITMALTAGDRDVAVFKVKSIGKAVQLGDTWETSL